MHMFIIATLLKTYWTKVFQGLKQMLPDPYYVCACIRTYVHTHTLKYLE